jgi:hypothetical protein
MGFWHTGYIEFHEPVGLGDDYKPSPPVYVCQRCNAEFLRVEDLRAHRFEMHPFRRPVLLIRGVEVGSTAIRISRGLAATDVEVLKCERAYLNGEPIAVDKLGSTLSRFGNGFLTIELSNTGASARFELQIGIATEADILSVEQSFLGVARRGRLDMRSIEDFIGAARSYRSAVDYYDGISEYFYGVLAKECAKDSSLAYEEYRDKWSRSADKLKDFRRPLADCIRAIIDFHFNHFREAAALTPTFRVGVAGQRFNSWIRGDVAVARAIISHSVDDRFEKLLTDFETERLLTWSVAKPNVVLRQADELEALLRKEAAEYDRTKVRILLAETYAETGSASLARYHARELRNNLTLRAWAERVISGDAKE